MNKTRKVSAEKVIRTIINCRGHLFRTARRLGITTRTLENYRKENPAIQQAVEKARGMTGDLAESKLIQAIEKGEAWAICFYLKTQCKNRGYIERTEQQIDHGGEIRFAGKTPEQVRADIVNRLTQAGKN